MFDTAIRLAVFDYDGTQANTFAPSSRGVTVASASALALQQLFGPQGAELFDELGGLQNRSPGELIDACLKQNDRQHLLDAAHMVLRTHARELSRCVPLGKGVPLKWSGEAPLRIVTEIFVRLKLRVLLAELDRCSIWPEPYPGVLNFFEHAAERHLLSATLSAGHECFITRSYEKWGVRGIMPCTLLTDDDLRGRGSYPQKPNPELFDEVLELIPEARCVHRGHMLLVGDDEKRDGILAFNSGVRFAWHNPQSRQAEVPEGTFVFRHWDELHQEFDFVHP